MEKEKVMNRQRQCLGKDWEFFLLYDDLEVVGPFVCIALRPNAPTHLLSTQVFVVSGFHENMSQVFRFFSHTFTPRHVHATANTHIYPYIL